jgi:hypothetical protein
VKTKNSKQWFSFKLVNPLNLKPYSLLIFSAPSQIVLVKARRLGCNALNDVVMKTFLSTGLFTTLDKVFRSAFEPIGTANTSTNFCRSLLAILMACALSWKRPWLKITRDYEIKKEQMRPRMLCEK